MTAVAERPNGIRIRFQPFPTPVVGDNGELLAAVNMLVEMTGYRGPALRGRRDGSRTSSIERVNQALKTFTVGDVQDLVEEIEAELDRRPPRLLN
jgi:hypothetical protein